VISFFNRHSLYLVKLTPPGVQIAVIYFMVCNFTLIHTKIILSGWRAKKAYRLKEIS